MENQYYKLMTPTEFKQYNKSQEEMKVILPFLKYLAENGIVLCSRENEHGEFKEHRENSSKLICDYFGISN